MSGDSILRKRAISRQRVSGKLAAGWARIVSQTGKGAFADRIEISTGTVDNALTGKTVPELHTALNSLLIDPTALDEVLALYGLRACLITTDAANDLSTISGLSRVVSEWATRLIDGKRCHTDTAALAKLFRPLLAEMQAIVAEADAA